MKISELENEIATFRQQHGNINVDAGYQCFDCDDWHDGHGLRLILTEEGKMKVEVIQLGED